MSGILVQQAVRSRSYLDEKVVDKSTIQAVGCDGIRNQESGRCYL